jgi:hypothetical protein
VRPTIVLAKASAGGLSCSSLQTKNSHIIDLRIALPNNPAARTGTV